MFVEFAAKILPQTAKCRQLIKKNAEKVNFYAKKFDHFKKKQYFCALKRQIFVMYSSRWMF